MARIFKLWGSSIAEGATRTGPMGQDPSRPGNKSEMVHGQLARFRIAEHTLRKRPLTVLELLGASTDIVAAGVSQHVAHGLVLGDVATAFR